MSATRERHIIPGQYVYDGDVQLGEFCQPESIVTVRNLQLDPQDVIVASYPKTGTTFLQEIVWLVRHDADVDLANQTYSYERVPFIEDTTVDNIALLAATPRPRTIKTHLPHRLLPKQALCPENGAKILYIHRNPRDTLVSYYHFYRSTSSFGNFAGTWDEYFQMFYEDNKGLLYYGNIFDHYKGFWKHKSDSNVLLLCYEDMVRNHKEHVKKIAEFLNVELDDEKLDKIVEATSFDTMKKNPKTNYKNMPDIIDHRISEFIRKGKIGDWKDYFSPDQLTKLSEMEKEKIGGLGVDFIYE